MCLCMQACVDIQSAAGKYGEPENFKKADFSTSYFFIE